MRTFKSKPFARWARKEGLNDAGLLDAVDEMEEGNIDANLGGQVYKKRVALASRGKRGGVRTLIAYQDGEKAFFMFGFAKNERSNISKDELKALNLMASRILKELHESAKGLHDAGAMDITTMREFDALCLPPVKKMTARQIKIVRAKYKLSQPVFAAYLNLSPSTIRQWENGDKEPSGPSLKLLNIVRDKGLAALA